MGQVAEQLPPTRFHRLQPFGHLIESCCQFVELMAQSGGRGGHPDVVAPLGHGRRRTGHFGDRLLQAAAEVEGGNQRGQGGHRGGHRDRQRRGVLIRLFGVVLLIGAVSDAGHGEMLPEQRGGPDRGRDNPGRHPGGGQNHALGQQQTSAHSESAERVHCPVPIR